MNNTLSYKTENKLYDLSLLEEMDDEEYLLEMIGDVLSDIPKDLKEMQDAAKAGKVEIVASKAHKLKSSVGIIQAKAFITLLEKIEIAGKKNAPIDEINILVSQSSTQFAEIETALKAHVA